MIRDCRPSFVITDADRIDRVQFAAATRTESTAADINVCNRMLKFVHFSVRGAPKKTAHQIRNHNVVKI